MQGMNNCHHFVYSATVICELLNLPLGYCLFVATGFDEKKTISLWLRSRELLSVALQCRKHWTHKEWLIFKVFCSFLLWKSKQKPFQCWTCTHTATYNHMILNFFLEGIWEGLEVWSRYEYWIAPVGTAAMRTKPPKVIAGIFFLLWGFSLVPISRVVCKAMPLLWSATCSRRLPLDLKERRVSVVPMLFCSDPPQNTRLLELFLINQHPSFI